MRLFLKLCTVFFFGSFACAQCNLDLGNDTILCDNASIFFNAGSGFDSYLWQNGSTSQFMVPTTTGTYWCQVTGLDTNLIVNGDFESGNTNFTSDYIVGTGGTWGPISNEGEYLVTTSPQIAHSNFPSCGDHTTGSGQMMVVNGSGVPNENIWCQTVNVLPNTAYTFSMWMLSFATGSFADITLVINGVQVGPNYIPTNTGCTWNNFTTTWNSGVNTTAQVCIVNQNIQLSGNDFAIDDLSFSTICTTTDSVDVTFLGPPQIDLGPDTILCENANLLLDVTVPNGSYSWQDNSIDSVFNVVMPGTYWVTVSENGCVSNDSITVDYQIIQNDLGNDTAICQGTSIVLDATYTGSTYLWQDGSTDSTLTVNQTGTYWVEVTQNSCSKIDSVDINVIPLPTGDLGNDTSLCQGDDLLLNVFEPNVTYQWQDNSSNSSFLAGQTGIYWVEMTFNGCSITDSISIDYFIVPNLNLGNDTTLCLGETLMLNASSTNATYLWQDNSTGATLDAGITGQYYVTMTQNGCVYSDSIDIDYFQPLNLQLPSMPDVCQGEEVILTHNISQGLVASSHWTFSSGDESFNYTPSHAFEYSGQNFYSLTITTMNGCLEQANGTINVIPKPHANFFYSPEKPNKENEVNFTDISQNAIQWNWTFGNGSFSNDQNPTTVYTTPGVYSITLEVYNEFCSDEITKSIFVNDEVVFYVPNVFTPNSNGQNETFKPIFTSGFDPYDFHLRIYNRYGQIVFESFDASAGWDGTYNDSPVLQGTYVWQIEFGNLLDDKTRFENGQVTIIR